VKVASGNFESNSAADGGALFATSNGAYQMSSSEFRSNKADHQGGVFYSDFLSRVCSKFEDVDFVSNSAEESGGAFFFDLTPSNTLVKMKNSNNDNSGISIPCGDHHQEHDSSYIRVSSFCKSCGFSNNKAIRGYGSNYATSPTTLLPRSSPPHHLFASQTFNTSFEVKDAFNQTLSGFIGTPFYIYSYYHQMTSLLTL